MIVFAVIFVFARQQAEKKAYEEEKNSAFSTASNRIDDGQYDDAITLLTDLIEKYPEDYRGYEYLADAYAETGQYEEALAVLDDGEVNVEDNDFSSQYDEISQKKEYTEAIASAKSNIEAGNIEQAQADYTTAIEIDEENVLAYEGMADLYIGQGKYDDGVAWLDSAACDYDTKTELQAKCLLAKVDKMMNDGDYENLLNFFKTDRNSILAGVSTYYYQDGQVRDNIEGGKGLILSTWGVYSGDIVNGSREGSGKHRHPYVAGHRVRHRQGAAGAHLRALCHIQAGRHRAGTCHRRADRPGPRRKHFRDISGKRRNGIPRLSSCIGGQPGQSPLPARRYGQNCLLPSL